MKLNPSRFQVRQPAPDYPPRPDWRTLAWCAVGVAIVLMGAAVEGYAQDKPDLSTSQIAVVDASLTTWTQPTRITFQAGSGSVVIDCATGKVEVTGVTLDTASRQFWDKVASAFPDFRESVLAGYRAGLREKEPPHRYTVQEIDALRRACMARWLYGTTVAKSGFSRSFKEEEMDVAVEELVRTAMLAGHTAQDLYDADKPKGKTP